MPNAFVPPLAWLEVFCREPLVYHAIASLLNLELLSAGTGSAATRKRMLLHKGEAVAALNRKLSNLKADDIETALIGMVTLYPDEEEVVRASALGPSLFVSHMPWVNNTTIYAGVDPKGLHHAVESLVARAGGLLNLKLQAFPKTMSK